MAASALTEIAALSSNCVAATAPVTSVPIPSIGMRLSREGKYLMTGLLKCPECGYRFVSHSDLKRNQYYYACGTRSRRTSGCGNKLWVQMKRFETQLFQKMEETILSDGFLEDYIQRCQTDSPQEKVGW